MPELMPRGWVDSMQTGWGALHSAWLEEAEKYLGRRTLPSL